MLLAKKTVFKKLLYMLAAGALLAPIAACSKTPQPIKKGMDTDGYGYVVSGGKFGVSVGDTKAAAKEKLLSEGIKDYGQDSCSAANKKIIDCADGDHFDVYRKQSFSGNGLIYVFVENDKVVALAWSLNYGPDL